LYFNISSPTTMSEPALYILLTLQAPNIMSIFFRFGHLSKESVQVRGFLWIFITSLLFTVSSCEPHTQPPSWRTTPCRLSAAAYSTYLQLPSISGSRLLLPTWGRTMAWWHGTHLTWHMNNEVSRKREKHKDLNFHIIFADRHVASSTTIYNQHYITKVIIMFYLEFIWMDFN
jgi:hypothetical protein